LFIWKHSVEKILRFSTEIAVYPRNGKRWAHSYYGSLIGVVGSLPYPIDPSLSMTLNAVESWDVNGPIFPYVRTV